MSLKIASFQFNYFGENTYIVWDEASREAAIIDPGMMNDHERKTLSDFISSRSLNVKYLINTHIHVDHVMGDDYVKDTYGVGLSASPLDAFLAARVAEQARMFHLPVQMPESIEIEHPLADGDTLYLGDSTLEVISVPGHSPGSIALWSQADGIVFVGDALFNGSIGRTDLPGGDYATLIKAITDRLLTLPPSTTVLSGHGPSTTIAEEAASNPYI